MESSSSKVEAIKPVLFKAGIPLAVTLAGFIIARIATRKSCSPTASSLRVDIVQETDSGNIYTDEENSHNLNSESLSRVEDDHACAVEILGLRRRIEDMGKRELQLEKRFLYYQGLKDQEVMLMELYNKMVLEINRVEVLEREASFIEAENQRFESAARECMMLLRLDEVLRSENEMLRKKVKKLLRRTRQHSRILRKQCLQIQCNETEITIKKNELEEKADCIKELKLIIEELQGERNELLCNLRAAEESLAASKVEEEYNGLAHEQEQLEEHEVSEVKKLRSQEHTEEDKEANSTSSRGIEEFGSDYELNQRGVEQQGLIVCEHAHSKRRKLIAKFKKWVEGSDKTKQSRLDEMEKHGAKCFPRHSVSDAAEDAYIPARKSCSSV